MNEAIAAIAMNEIKLLIIQVFYADVDILTAFAEK